MSKEYLEALEHIYYGSQGYGETDKYYKYLKEYLETIENANPSEALRCLEKLKDVEVNMCCKDFLLFKVYEKEFNTIKQALLKAQEPKHYLKWDDLKKLGKEIKVKLNDVEYLLCKKIVLGFPEYYLYPEGNQKPVLMCLGDNDYEKQFFNDLHLEVIENG